MAAATTTAAAASSDEACKDDDALSSTLRSCANDPDFAVICAFLQKFGKSLGFDLPSFKHLQEWLTNNDEVSAPLRDLHIKLLRKTRKTVHEKNWETAISKFCFSYSVQDAWEIERFGYKNSSLKVKLRIFRELLECQFERNAKFRAHLLTLSADSLRAQPIGRDRLGHSYWLTQDDDCNLRIYQEHLDEEIWQVVATNRDEFVQLIARLRGNEVVLPSKDIGEADEDTSSSNSCNAPVEKPPPPEEKEDDSQEEEAKVPNLKIKFNTAHASPTIVDNDDEDTGKSKKVKPLLITQAKLASSSPASNKKRSGDDMDKHSPSSDELQTQKKPRPTLLDAKRIKKPSRYETPKSEDDNGQDTDEHDDSDLDGEEEEDLDEDDEAGSEELEGEEEDIDSAAAEEDENEEKEDIEDFDDDDEDDDEVGEAIEDPPVIVRGQGSGRDCNAVRPNFEYTLQDEFFLGDYNDEDNIIVGDTIEEPLLLITGQGNGADCLVGNKTESKPTESNEPKATFFFGEPGCLKLSPIKQTPKPETKKSIFDSLSSHEEMQPDQEKQDVESEKPVNVELEKLSTEKTNGESIKSEETCHYKKSEISPKVKTQQTNETVTKEDNTSDERIVNEETENECEKSTANLTNEQNTGGSKIVATKETKNKTEIVLEVNQAESKDEQVEASNAVKDISKNNGRDKDKEVIEEITNTPTVKKEAIEDKPKTSKSATPVEIVKPDSPKNECNSAEVTATPKSDILLSTSLPVKSQLTENGTVAKDNELTPVKSDAAKLIELIKKPETPKEISKHEFKREDPIKVEVNRTEVAIDTKAVKNLLSETKTDIKVDSNKTNEVPTSKLQAPSSNLTTPLSLSSTSTPTTIQKANTIVTTTSQPSTSAALQNRKRRLTDFDTTPQPPPSTRHSTSESEIDLHSEQQDELNQEDDLDIGGKRIKMRSKLANVELRRKVEAQKTQIEEATSSSGEEDARSRRKIIAPKRKFERTPEKSVGKPRHEKITVDKTTADETEVAKGSIEKSAEKEQIVEASKSQNSVDKVAVVKPIENKPTVTEAAEKKQTVELPMSEKIAAGKEIKDKPTTDETSAEKIERKHITAAVTVAKPTEENSVVGKQADETLNQENPNKESEVKKQIKEKSAEENLFGKLPPKNSLTEEKIAPEKSLTQKLHTENLLPEKILAECSKAEKPAEEKQAIDKSQLTPPNIKNQVPDKPVIRSLLAPMRLTTEKSTPEKAAPHKSAPHEKPTPTIKHKPTLAEIIEKKLKKTTEKPQDIKPTEYPTLRPAVLRPPYNKPLEQTPTESKILKAPVLKPQEQKSLEPTKLKPAVLKIPEIKNMFKTKETKALESKSTELQPPTELKIPEFKPSILKPSELKPVMDKITVAQAAVQKSPPLLESTISKLHVTAAATTKEKPRELTPPPQVVAAKPAETASTLFTPPADTTPAIFTPPKKSPITKPLKKNLLTQIRQEESDEEAIPRKRTISENLAPTTSTGASQSVESVVRPAEVIKSAEISTEVAKNIRRTPDRQTPERQRKRRSSEDAKTTETLPSSGTTEQGVSEKIKRNDEVVKETAKSAHPEDLKIVEEVSKDELKAEKESTPEPAQLTTGRRSGRRGGAAVVYTELPQPKRTRGGAKTSVAEKSEVIKVEKEVEDDQTSLVETKNESANKKTLNKKGSAKESPPPKLEKKSLSNVKVEPPKQEVNLEQEKTIVKTEVELDKTPEETVATETVKSSPNSKADANNPSSVATPRGRGSRKKREVDATNIIDTNDVDTPVRQSRRIAQQKIKEEAERRKMEEIALRSMKQELKKKKKAEKETDPTVIEPSGESSSESEVELKKKAKKKCPGKDGWSSGSEEQEDTEEEVEEPPHEYSDHGSPLFRSDHEFSPESDLEDESQVVPMKRARTARKENAEEGEADDADEACAKCGKSDHPEWILLCDNCDKGYHCSCLSPVLFYIPEGDWYCPPCQQEQLIIALEQQLKEFDDLVARKETEKLLAEQAEREEQQRLEAEKREEEERRAAKKEKKKNKRRNGSGSDGSRNSDDDGTDDSDKRSKDSDDDSDDRRSKASKTTSKRAKQSEKSEKRRRGDGRSNRRAAKRGTRRRRRRDSESGSDSKSGSGSGSDTGSRSSSSSFSDSDDEPIYKLRKRRQINVSYRLNEYDDLINSALKKEMDEVAGAGNLGRGKDITTIIEADKEEKARQRQIEEGEDDVKEEEQGENPKIEKTKPAKSNKTSENEKDNDDDDDDDDDDDVPLKVKAKPKSSLKKKSRKLTTLDISSEEDHGSDEDFKTSSFDDDEEDTSISASESDSDSSLEVYRRRGKSGGRGKHQRKAARRAARERRKDRKFVVDESDESEEVARPKTKKKRKGDSDYTESESDGDEDLSELSENVDSADLCDDTTSESSDGAWHPSKRKKQRKSNATIARKSPKLKKPVVKKPKRIEYSDDDISETEPEDDDEEDDGITGSGKGSGKQPRSQPLKTTVQSSKPKTKSPATAKKKKKPPTSDEHSGSDDSTRRTRGRRYAYLEDFDDDSSDGGIKPGVKRPDTPPEERQKFIQKQEEIKRMLAEKNAEGAKLAATPRLTPIKGTTVAPTDKRTPTKANDSLSTVPLSVIRQAKVLDIDYLQRKGENVGELENVDDVESEFDDADFPDDLPDDMDEDAIARMVEEEEFSAAAAARELPAPDEVLRTTNKSKSKLTEPANASDASNKPVSSSAAAAPPPQPPPQPPPPTASQPATSNASGLQEPMRKRLPMPTMHPPLLRHQFPPHHGMPPHHLMQRHPGPPPMQLLQNALSAPLGQPLNRNAFPPHPAQQALPPHPAMQRLPLGMPPGAHGHGLPPAHLMHAAVGRVPPTSISGGTPTTQVAPPARDPPPSLLAAEAPESKPRGRRKKITPLRDSLQKQQTAAAVTAATTTSGDKPLEPGASIKTTAASGAGSGVTLTIAQPPQLYKPHGAPDSAQPSVITRMPHLPPHAVRPPPGAAMYANAEALHARFYGQPLPPSTNAGGGTRSPATQQQQQHSPSGTNAGAPNQQTPPSQPPRHLLRPPLPPGMPPHSAMRPTYGPPPPLRGSVPPSNVPPGSAGPAGSRPPYLHGDHHGPGSLAGVYAGGPPPARHSTVHLNPYRPTIYGNPNFPPRVAPPGAQNLRAGASPHAVDYAAGPRGYPPYGYYPPPPPLTTPAHSQPPHTPTTDGPLTNSVTSAPSSVIVSAPPATAAVPPPPAATAASALTIVPTPPTTVTPTNHSVTALTRHTATKTPPPPSSAAAPPAPAAAVAKSVITESRKKLTTLEAYSATVTKSPLTVAGESSGSPAGLQSTDAAEDSSSAPGSSAAAAATAAAEGASEFSGLVSYFSSQHDDYNT